MRKFRTFVFYTEPSPEDPAMLVPVKEILLDGTSIEYTGFDTVKNLMDEIEPKCWMQTKKE